MVSGEDIQSAEQIQSFLILVGEGRLSDRDARAAIETAEITTLYFDIDRYMRWQSATATSTQDHKAESSDEQSGVPPFQSSMLCGSITMHGRTFGFGPSSFTGLLRDVFEQDEPVGVPRHTLAGLCMAAGSKIKSVPVEYSFACALAYCMELDGDRAGARRLWEPYALLTPRTWASVEFESLFLEVNAEESPQKLVAAEAGRASAQVRDQAGTPRGRPGTRISAAESPSAAAYRRRPLRRGAPMLRSGTPPHGPVPGTHGEARAARRPALDRHLGAASTEATRDRECARAGARTCALLCRKRRYLRALRHALRHVRRLDRRAEVPLTDLPLFGIAAAAAATGLTTLACHTEPVFVLE